MPSASRATMIGRSWASAWDVSRQDRPAIEPESSIRRMVSKVVRKVYGSSSCRAELVEGAGDEARAAAAFPVYAGAGLRVGPDVAVGEGVYAGGGSLEGTVNAFMPGRSEGTGVSLALFGL